MTFYIIAFCAKNGANRQALTILYRLMSLPFEFKSFNCFTTLTNLTLSIHYQPVRCSKNIQSALQINYLQYTSSFFPLAPSKAFIHLTSTHLNTSTHAHSTQARSAIRPTPQAVSISKPSQKGFSR